MTKLSFKQYLESKDQLIKAISNVPISLREYEVRNYCTLTVGEDEDEKKLISLKPKAKIIVEWQYDNIHQPLPLSVKVVGSIDADDESFSTYWSSTKLRKWLSCHTTELQVIRSAV